ncbi:hypothetical protein CGT87_13400 [Vibrio cholerae]|nr:hypothetical protein CGT87_13400 [Vibrio cholerae]
MLATFVPPNHLAAYAHGDELTCRLPTTPSSLGIMHLFSGRHQIAAKQTSSRQIVHLILNPAVKR